MTQYATEQPTLSRTRLRRSARALTLHPRGQGFWWLVVEPPLLVILAGLVFHLLVAQPLVRDLEEAE
jgi:hypothetical protein